MTLAGCLGCARQRRPEDLNAVHRFTGRTCHFCSLGWKQQFDRSPEKFAEE